MTKKLIAIFLSALMLFSFISCGKNNGGTSGGNTNGSGTNNSNSMPEGFVVKGEEAVELGTPSSQLDPKTVYSKLTYTPKMFYGDYRLIGGDEAQEKFGSESQYFTYTQNGEECEITKLPFRIEAGKHTLMHSINYIEEYNWMRLYFMRRNETGCFLYTVLCAYTVEDNTLTLKPLDTFNVDTENSKISYTFADVTWQYNFEFSGRNLTLSSDENSIVLTTSLSSSEDTAYFHVDNYLSPESAALDNIDNLSLRYKEGDSDTHLHFENVDGENSYCSIGVLQENGLFTFTVPFETSTKTYQYVYFYCGTDGLILTDGTNTYYYNDNYSDRTRNELNKFVTEDQTGKLDELSDSQLEAIVEKTEDLLEDLATAYQQAGLSVNVNTQTGEIALDSTVLFDVNESAISDEGKVFLQQFMDVYTSVVFGDKYEDFISRIIVEGHTDTNGSYELNQTLSQARADSVKEYCLSAECGIDPIDTDVLQTMLEAIGYSYDKPVYDENGEVDMDASRRVSFRFIVNLEKQG